MSTSSSPLNFTVVAVDAVDMINRVFLGTRCRGIYSGNIFYSGVKYYPLYIRHTLKIMPAKNTVKHSTEGKVKNTQTNRWLKPGSLSYLKAVAEGHATPLDNQANEKAFLRAAVSAAVAGNENVFSGKSRDEMDDLLRRLVLVHLADSTRPPVATTPLLRVSVPRRTGTTKYRLRPPVVIFSDDDLSTADEVNSSAEEDGSD